MAEPFLGMIILVPYNFAPRGWAFCSGQIMAISQNTALFSLLGTTFGGNGQTTFALPDLRGRVPVSSGQGPGLSSYDLGQVSGSESVTLTSNNLPAHNHQFNVSSVDADDSSGTGKYFASSGSATFKGGVTPNQTLGPLSIGPAGGSQPISILQPYLAVNFCIALEGIFPSRN
jgi:microcystin-dependent protein